MSRMSSWNFKEKNCFQDIDICRMVRVQAEYGIFLVQSMGDYAS